MSLSVTFQTSKQRSTPPAMPLDPSNLFNVALFPGQMQLGTEQQISRIARMFGMTLDGLLKAIPETQSFPNPPFAIPFDEVVPGAHR
jgi:hypothetical protein